MPYYNITTLTAEELKDTTLLAQLKGGELLKGNKSIYFRHPSHFALQEYRSDYIDYIMEWAAMNLKLNDLQKTLVFENERKVPVRCTFKNGKASDYCFILLTHFPPRQSFFADGYKPNWYYLNQIMEMFTSPRAVGKEIWSAMLRMEHKKRTMTSKIMKLKGNVEDHPEFGALIKKATGPVVVSNEKGALFKFTSIQQLVYDEDVNPVTFSLINTPTPQQIQSARELSLTEDPNADRKDIRPPSAHVYIIADSESDTTDQFLLNEI